MAVNISNAFCMLLPSNCERLGCLLLNIRLDTIFLESFVINVVLNGHISRSFILMLACNYSNF